MTVLSIRDMTRSFDPALAPRIRCAPKSAVAANTRSRSARSSELERHPFASQLDLAFSGGTDLVRSGEDTFQLLVRVERVVVEEHEPPRAGPTRERHDVLGARVSPADPLVVLLLGVLGVMQEHRRSLSQRDA